MRRASERRPARVRLLPWLATAALLPACTPPWPLFDAWPVDAAEYELEELPAVLSASYARGHDVYWGLSTGEVVRVADDDPNGPRVSLGAPLDGGPRLLFASTRGTVFASADRRSLYRTTDNATWAACLDVPVWRMDEDDEGSLYAGNYTKDPRHVATLYKSTDDGASWTLIFRDPTNDHIHTVRWDSAGQRLYIAFGDGRWPGHLTRGEAYSDDRGATFHDLARGPRQGHTDVAFTDDYVIWCSDDQSGRVFRVRRTDGAIETVFGDSQFVWFGAASGQQIYAGTMTSGRFGGERAALLASDDQGQTWRKLLETSPSAGPYDRGFYAESRALSAGGWLYCTARDEPPRSFRVRHVAPSPLHQRPTTEPQP